MGKRDPGPYSISGYDQDRLVVPHGGRSLLIIADLIIFVLFLQVVSSVSIVGASRRRHCFHSEAVWAGAPFLNSLLKSASTGKQFIRHRRIFLQKRIKNHWNSKL